MTVTVGAAQHIPLQPAATTANGSFRLATSSRSLSSVSSAPTAIEQAPAPRAPAAHPGAGADEPAPGPREAQVGIVARGTPDLALRHAQVRGDLFEGVGRQPALGALGLFERRQEPRALAGKFRKKI